MGPELTDAVLMQLLQAGLSHDDAVRKQLEKHLDQFYHQPGFFIQLLRAIKVLVRPCTVIAGLTGVFPAVVTRIACADRPPRWRFNRVTIVIGIIYQPPLR